MAEQSFFVELKKRKVVQVAAIYGAVAWGLTEVVVTIVEQLFLPQWVATLSVIGFVVGFPVAMFLAWTFDITPEGIRRTEVTSRRGTASIVLSVALLIAGTGGLFWLIKPVMQQGGVDTELSILPNSVAVMPFDNATGQYELAVHVLGSTGLPDIILNDQARSGWDWYAYFILVNATFGLGDRGVARGLAQWFLEDPTHHDNPESSVESFKSCCLAVLGRDDEALDKFEEMLGSPRLPYVPMLKDSLCFQKYIDEPRYRAVLEHFEKRRIELRHRLPATLTRFGVTL